jgi:hypothetical protein
MTPEEAQKKEARIDTIRAQIDEIPAMLDGTLMTKHNRVTRKDGSIHVSPEHCTFQYRGTDGKRQWKRIPRNAKAAVGRLVRAAERYRALEREYTALLTELSLVPSGKKKDV